MFEHGDLLYRIPEEEKESQASEDKLIDNSFEALEQRPENITYCLDESVEIVPSEKSEPLVTFDVNNFFHQDGGPKSFDKFGNLLSLSGTFTGLKGNRRYDSFINRPAAMDAINEFPVGIKRSTTTYEREIIPVLEQF